MERDPHRRHPLHALVALVVAVAAAACSPQPHPIPPPGDRLIVAVTDEYGELEPIARYAEGVWDRPPWGVGVGLDRLVAAPGADSSEWVWPDGRRLWPETVRAWDTIGYSARPVAVNVPDEWYFHSDSAPDQTLVTQGLHLSAGVCGFSWSVRTRTDWGEPFPTLGDFRTAGVSLSRAPSAILPADEAPGIERIVAELGLGDTEPNPWDDSRFIWLGIFRFDDMTFGVLHRLGFGAGVMNAVVELQGDSARVVSEIRRGQLRGDRQC